MVIKDCESIDEQIAAIDLGSNSFHMVIARIVDDELQVVDRIKDMVRLAAGLDEETNELDLDSQRRALEALERFGERVHGMQPGSVRAVGTNTLRKAANSKTFLSAAEAALGHPIEIVPGAEEARLIYLGVAHDIGVGGSKRLVVDIGGGSTEFIIGEDFDPIIRESKYMGCVSYSQRYFPGGKVTREGYDQAVIAAQQELQASVKSYRELGWKRAVGASGTIRAIWDMSVSNDIGKTITLDGLKELRKRTIEIGVAEDLNDIKGLSSRRAPVLPGGLAILIGAFKSLKIDEMIVSDGALREGAIIDLVGRLQNRDVRDETIANLAAHNQVDEDHASRVEETALHLLDEVASDWELDGEVYRQFLRWASHIHEIGLSISHSKYHKHGSYLVENTDMPGFSRGEQKFLWALVRSHRRSFKTHRFSDLKSPLPVTGPRLAILLRLSVLLNRSRQDDAVPETLKVKIRKGGKQLRLKFPDGWLEDSPLTRADLQEEKRYLKPDYKLKFK